MTTIIPSRLLRRAAATALLIPALAAMTACDDDPVEVEPEPTFNRMVLTFTPTGGAAQAVTITRADASVSGPITVNGGGTLVATFLNADNSTDQLATTGADFETRVNVPNAFTAVSFTRTGPHTFTVTRNGAGTGAVEVQLFHLGENHDELEANVTVQAPPL